METFIYATVIESKSQKSIQGFTRPFDTNTWMFLMIWTFIFFVYVFVSNDQKNVKAELLFFIVEQSQYVSLEGSKKIHLWIFFCWSILAVILSSVYKGKVLELISNPTYPPVPRFVEEITEMGYAVTSFTAYSDDNQVWDSIFRATIENLKQDWETGIKTIDNLNILNALSEDLIWSERDSLFQYMGDLLKNRILYNRVGDIKKKIEITSGPFVFMDFSDIVQVLQKLVKMATHKRKCVLGKALPILAVRWHFLTKEEWYSRLVAPYLAKYAESGIQARWLEFESLRSMFQDLSGFQDWWAERDPEMRIGNILQHLLAGKHVLGRNEFPEPVEISHFVVIGTPMFYFGLLAVVLFIVEVCFVKILVLFHILGNTVSILV